MDARFNIYAADEVPDEDRARLEGYLHARAEADVAAHAEHLAELKAEFLEAQRQREETA